MIIALRTMIRDEEGATLIEYGLIVGLIALIALTAITLVGQNLRRVFRTLPSTL